MITLGNIFLFLCKNAYSGYSFKAQRRGAPSEYTQHWPSFWFNGEQEKTIPELS